MAKAQPKDIRGCNNEKELSLVVDFDKQKLSRARKVSTAMRMVMHDQDIGWNSDSRWFSL